MLNFIFFSILCCENEKDFVHCSKTLEKRKEFVNWKCDKG